MKTMEPTRNATYIAEVISKEGRSGTLRSPDGVFNLVLSSSPEDGERLRGPNPELLFAGAYAACYHGALKSAAAKLGLSGEDSTVRAGVSLVEDGEESELAVELHAWLPGLDREQTEYVMEAAHRTCPYSKALRQGVVVKLVAD